MFKFNNSVALLLSHPSPIFLPVFERETWSEISSISPPRCQRSWRRRPSSSPPLGHRRGLRRIMAKGPIIGWPSAGGRRTGSWRRRWRGNSQGKSLVGWHRRSWTKNDKMGGTIFTFALPKNLQFLGETRFFFWSYWSQTEINEVHKNRFRLPVRFLLENVRENRRLVLRDSVEVGENGKRVNTFCARLPQVSRNNLACLKLCHFVVFTKMLVIQSPC